MIFKGVRSQTIELKILGYELPENFGPSYEANFLEILLTITGEQGHWQTDSCALSTTDLEKTIDWFHHLEQGMDVPALLSFGDKGISFEHPKGKDGRDRIRVYFHSECRPPDAGESREYYMDLESGDQTLREISAGLQTELDAFPSRGFAE